MNAAIEKGITRYSFGKNSSSVKSVKEKGRGNPAPGIKDIGKRSSSEKKLRRQARCFTGYAESGLIVKRSRKQTATAARPFFSFFPATLASLGWKGDFENQSIAAQSPIQKKGAPTHRYFKRAPTAFQATFRQKKFPCVFRNSPLKVILERLKGRLGDFAARFELHLAPSFQG